MAEDRIEGSFRFSADDAGKARSALEKFGEVAEELGLTVEEARLDDTSVHLPDLMIREEEA